MTILYEDELEDIYEALRPPPPFPKRRFPLEPLLDRFGGNTAALAKAANVERRTVQRWVKNGLTFRRADRICCSVNEFPPHVWLDWTLDDTEYAERQAAATVAAA